MSSSLSSLWIVYILKAANGSLYTGITTDIERRFFEHKNNPKKGARFFNFSVPEEILYQESYPCRSSASKREYEIKQMNRKQKIALIAQKKLSTF